jgi:hypothetical protein
MPRWRKALKLAPVVCKLGPLHLSLQRRTGFHLLDHVSLPLQSSSVYCYTPTSPSSTCFPTTQPIPSAAGPAMPPTSSSPTTSYSASRSGHTLLPGQHHREVLTGGTLATDLREETRRTGSA